MQLRRRVTHVHDIAPQPGHATSEGRMRHITEDDAARVYLAREARAPAMTGARC
jgi:hypothetical protein